jgi:hypothetical protein
VTINYVTTTNERENWPLEIVPLVQVPEVQYYLVFRAVLPSEILREAKALRDRLPRSTIDAFLTAIDSGSDAKMFVHSTFKIPQDVLEGIFLDAVATDESGNITGVCDEYLDKVVHGD